MSVICRYLHFIVEENRSTKVHVPIALLQVNGKTWIHTQAAGRLRFHHCLPQSPRCHPSTCVFITPNFFVTRKMKKKASPSDNEGISVRCKLLRFSYFLCSASVSWVWVQNFLNPRKNLKNNPTSRKTQLFPNCAMH